MGMTESPQGECASCGEGDPPNECPLSQRPCGHHCNHIWTHDCCDWCGGEYVSLEGEDPVWAQPEVWLPVDSGDVNRG